MTHSASRPDRPARSQGAAPPADGLRRGPPAVLPRAAHGRRDVQPLLLVPGGSADVRRALRLRTVDDQARPADAADPACRRPASGHATTPPSTSPYDIDGAAMLSIRRILRDYEDAGSLNSLHRALGIRRRQHVSHEGRARRRGVPPGRSRLRVPRPGTAPGHRPSVRSGAPRPG